MNSGSTSQNYLALALLSGGILLAVAVYWPGLFGSFFFDDYPNILMLPEVRLKTLSLDSIRQALESGHSGPLGRPISYLSFALNYYFSEYAPFPYKLTNLAIHGLNGILVFSIALHVLAATRLPGSDENTRRYAAIVAMAWLLHPIQLTSVLYVVQRMTSLSAFFMLAALLLYITARQRCQIGWIGIVQMLLAWLVFWPLSIYSKETGLLFIGFIFIYEAIIQKSINQGIDPFGKILLGAILCLIIGILIYLLTPPGQMWLLGGYGSRSFTLTERLLTESRIIWFYLGLIFLPRLSAFSLYHDDIALSTGLLDPWTTLPALVGIFGLFSLVWLTRLRNPLISFAIAWFLVAHGLESTIFSLELVHEHRNYIGLFGVLLLPVVLIRMQKQHNTLKFSLIALTLSMLVFSVLTTALRSHQFGDGLRQSLMEAENHPLSSRSNYNAGTELVKHIPPKDRLVAWYNLIREYYELSVKLDQNSKVGLLGLIQLNCTIGQAYEQNWIDELEQRLANTLFEPADRNVLYIVRDMFLQNIKCLKNQDVHRLFKASLSNKTASSQGRMFLYTWYSDYLLFHENDLTAAIQALSKAKKIAPSEPHLQKKWDELIKLDQERNQASSG